jgi:hypothetical protein
VNIFKGGVYESCFIYFNKEVEKMRNMLILFILLIFISPAYAATTYRWIDEKGVVGFTDDFNIVPPEYRDKVSKEVMEETPPVGVTASSEAIPQKIEEAKTDIYGLGESYWRERVRPWKDQLKEATENYESVNKKFMESAEELSQRRYGSRTQIKMNIIELDRLNIERMEYEAQIEEAKGKLAKISNEAKESGADPEWIN